MKTVIIIYLLLGIFLSFFGSLAKSTNSEIRLTQFDASKYFKLRKTLFNITLRTVSTLLYPIYYYDYFFNKKIIFADERIPIFKEDGKLYFHKMGGVGEIHCKICNYSEDIISFTHGYGRPPDSRRCHSGGYQCEDCGKFNTINGFEGEKDIVKNCDCGGKLHNDKPLFCPSCKSQSVGYSLRYLT